MQAVQQTLFSVPSIKSPLSYIGGKSKVTRLLYSYMPAGITEIVSPFVGSAGFELFLAAQGIRVHGYDNFPPLVNFWQHMLTAPSKLVAGVSKYLPPHEHYHELYDSYFDIPDSFDQAVAYWVINKGSFSNYTLAQRSVSYPDSRRVYKFSYFEKFRNFYSTNLSVACEDFRDSLARHPDTFAYCDPPYVGREYKYGDGNSVRFPHEVLSDILKSRGGEFMLSYNDDPLVRDLYPEGEFSIKCPKWTYGISGSSPSNELLIMRKPCT